MDRERKEEKGKREEEKKPMSLMRPVTEGAYGGGLYGTDDGGAPKQQMPVQRQPASDTQSADGPVVEPSVPKHEPPPSTGDRDLDITGQSYIQ
ncbi:hypothetical protein AMTRI_Chr09g35470 [Amborella trichopoda]|uniref:Uncharacterized protein n=1 Tax=Amborella trichopoda TaxID=13333 RepID=W1NWB4_AMBTC|nr:uncharacterized protein LOC18427000 [Amborella trichopoda]ERM98974.1 hypothetical protein AMTR_s00366p00014600 [Amborella trichopoda]|eukprot:XP_020518444.1 uncharacterized protein LOC18427000 [Amborella trichopoda]